MPNEGKVAMCSITVATPSERDMALATFQDAARRQAHYGGAGWSAESLVATVDQALPRGELCVVRRDDGVVGAFVLQWKDELIWGERPDDAGYVHKLAVVQAAAGQGVGLEIQRWAEERVRAAGRLYLRLDCDADNVRLNRYYREAGFTLHGPRVLSMGARLSLYEKAVS